MPPLFTWGALAMVLAATVFLFAPALRTAFFADDFLFLDQVRGRSLFESLRVPDPLSNFFRPVSRQLYFWTIARLTNESPLAFHIGNLLALLGVIALLFALVKRLAGPRAAVFAAAFLALQESADVPVRWACGSQDLLAVLFAVAAMVLFLADRRVLAGVAMLLAALSKEVVLLAPIIAVLAARRPREPWRQSVTRAWPLFAAVAVWAIIFLAMPHRRAAQSTEVEFDPVMSPIAAFAHLVQVTFGLEWLPGAIGVPKSVPSLAPALVAIGAIALAWRGASKPEVGATGARGAAGRTVAAVHGPLAPRRVVLFAAVWIVVATLPVAAVALLWSSYYYLFAMCGVALLLGVIVSRWRPWMAAAALALLAWGSANARDLEQFGIGRDPWTPVSHINRFYIERSNRISANYLGSLQRAHPTLPHGTTVFFGGLKGNVAFQRGDGPLLRWAYRDASLKSYYLNTFSHATARAGPLLFFVGSGDTLREMEPGPDLFLRVAFGTILADQPRNARDALDVAGERMPSDRRVVYWRAWVDEALGDTAAARGAVAATGLALDPAPATERVVVLSRVTAGDTLGALDGMRTAVREHPFDAASHGLLADLMLMRNPKDPDAAIEAFAARALAPNDPYSWRRWGMVQTERERQVEALKSFMHYFKLGGATADADVEAHRWVESLQALIPKGDVNPEEVPK